MKRLKSRFDSGEVLVIAEIGINHNGDYRIAEELILGAAQSGCSAIKFQYRNLNRSHGSINEIGDAIISNEIRRNFLSPGLLMELAKYAQSLEMFAGISFFCVEDLEDFGKSLGAFDFYKVPSVEHQNFVLINRLCEIDSSKLVLVATGTGTEQTIYESFSRLTHQNWVPLHCISNYPVTTFNSQLSYIQNLSSNWGRGSGYSSHDKNWAMCILAISQGATIIERHITLSKDASGLDHSSSSTPEEFSLLCEIAKSYRQILQKLERRIHNQGEMLNLQNLGRSLYATSDIQKGEVFDPTRFLYRSPRTGLTPYDSTEFLSSELKRPILAGEVLTRSHFIESSKLTRDTRDFANGYQLSIPIRFHDFEKIRNDFGLDNYEFHLSYQELLGDLPAVQGVKNLKFTIHLPDYCSSTSIVDPLSLDFKTRDLSLKIIEQGFEFASRLSDSTGNEVNLVGSFSKHSDGVEDFYEDYSNLLSKFNTGGSKLSLQWLPPIAWYFGGSVPLDVMNDIRAKENLLSHQIPIVMDTSHLFLGAEFFNFDSSEYVSDLRELISWFHISAASGIDGEGNNFSDANKYQREMLAGIMRSPKTKVIEVWQGHLNYFEGFRNAISDLRDLMDSEEK